MRTNSLAATTGRSVFSYALTFAVLLIASLPSLISFAVTKTWNVDNGLWNFADNWSPKGIPTSSDIVELKNNGTSILDSAATINAIRLGPSGGNPAGGGGNLQIASGSLNSSGGFLAEAASSNAHVTLFSSTWTNPAAMTIAYAGVGNLEMFSGSQLTRLSPFNTLEDSLFIGYQEGSDGTIMVDHSTLTNGGGRGIIVGYQGKGTVEVKNNSVIQNTGNLYVGYLPTATDPANKVTIENSTWTNTLTTWVGFAGHGAVFVDTGGMLNDAGVVIGAGSRGDVDGGTWNSSGNLVVSGTTSWLTLDGLGTFKAKSGFVQNSALVLNGSQFSTGGYLQLADNLTFNAGSMDNWGWLTVSSDPAFKPVDPGIWVGSSAGKGTLDIKAGGIVANKCTSCNVTIDGTTGTRMTVTGTGSKFTADDNTWFIGKVSTGEVNILSGGQATAKQIVVGATSDSSGAVTVDGVNSKLTATSSAAVGGYGSGYVIVRNHGSFKVGAGTDIANGTAKLTIGEFTSTGSVGTVIVDGSGSVLSVVGDLIVGGPLSGGVYGNGALTLQNNAFAESKTGLIGNFDGVGKVIVDNSSWFVSKYIAMGIAGGATLELRNGGLVVAPEGFTIGASGVLKGNGFVKGSAGVPIAVVNDGLLLPGLSPGTIHIDGNYTQNSTGKLQIELASNSVYDVLDVTGAANLGGTLEISLLNGYTPSPTDTFNILTSTSRSGVFNQVTVSSPSGGGRGSFDVGLTSTGIALSNFLAGDYNGDRQVDAADYVVWRKSGGSQQDYDLWRANFGRTAGSGATADLPSSAHAAIPEPTSIIHFAAALAFIAMRARHYLICGARVIVTCGYALVVYLDNYELLACLPCEIFS